MLRKTIITILLWGALSPAWAQMSDDLLNLMTYIAAGNNSVVIKLLAQNKVDINDQSYDQTSPLMLAAVGGHISLIQLLVEKGAEIDLVDGDGWTALMMSASQNKPAVLRTLISSGANLNKTNSDGHDAMGVAVINGSTNAIVALLEHRSKIKINSHYKHDGNTPLLLAVREQQMGAAETLIKGGADINTPSADGMTALIAAIGTSNIELTRKLIALGADPTIVTPAGIDALNTALAIGNTTLIKLVNVALDPDLDEYMWLVIGGHNNLLSQELKDADEFFLKRRTKAGHTAVGIADLFLNSGSKKIFEREIAVRKARFDAEF